MYIHCSDSVHLSKRHRASAGDDENLYSTNTLWEPEVFEGGLSHFDSALDDDIGGHHSVQCPNVSDAFGLGYDDPLNLFPLPFNLENTTSSSDLGIGNLESVLTDTFDVHPSYDHDFGLDDLPAFSIDDYLNSESIDLQSFSSSGADTASLIAEPTLLTPDSFQNSSPRVSGSPSNSGNSRSWTETSLLPGIISISSPKNTSPSTAAKFGIAPSLSFKCLECPKTFAFESRYK